MINKINPFDKLRINGEQGRTIKSIKAREILDSRGNPTLEVELTADFGKFLASVPSGASTGKYEAVELRDGGKRYKGKGVLKAVANVNEIIAPKLKGKDATQQKQIDDLMIKLDGTKNKAKLGANAMVGVSMAVCRAGAVAKNLPLFKYIAELSENYSPLILPTPCFNIINGGAHAGNNLNIQEFMVVPYAGSFKKIQPGRLNVVKNRPQVKPFAMSLQMGAEIYQELKKTIKKKYTKLATNIGDEGGFAVPVDLPGEALSLISKAIKNLNYKRKTKIILDVAASQFYKKTTYETQMGRFSREDLTKYYLKLIKKYPVIALEDPFAEGDLKGWKLLKNKIQAVRSKVIIIGDDLTVTNPSRIKLAFREKLCNGVIIKVNQIGTITETIRAVTIAKSYGWKIMVSHRSGETKDDFIADLSVGIGADFIKSGAPARGERVAKYNRLLKIEEELKN